MATNSINQGAAGGIIIQPTWGTIEGNGSPGKEDNFDAILNELRTYLDAKADKKDVYTKDDVYTKTETDDLLDDRLDVTSWKTTGQLSFDLPGTSDVTHADNNVTVATYNGFNIRDSHERLITRYETELDPNGKVSSIWYIRNYDTSGNIKGSKGLQMLMDKAGTLTWNVGNPENFRSAISAAPASHTHSNIVSRGNVTAETGANRPAVDGLSMSQAYNNGYPTNYGNVITLKGTGDGEIFVGWSGTSGARASTYLRSRRDTAGANWSSWYEVLDSGNYSSFALPKSGGSLSGPIVSQPGDGVSYIEGCGGASTGIYVKKPNLNVDKWIPGITIQTKTGGGWSIGNYNNESLQFAYGTKANIDAHNNSCNVYSIDTSGNFSGKAANVTGTVAIANGGTDATTAAGARQNLFPSDLASNGEYLIAITSSWAKGGYIAKSKALAWIGAAAASHSHAYLPTAGGTMSGRIIGKSSGGSWIGSRDNAGLYTGFDNNGAYYPCISFKTLDGEWSIGAFPRSNTACVNYSTDANYSANNNASRHILIPIPSIDTYFIVGSVGTAAMTDGTSALTTNTFYFQY